MMSRPILDVPLEVLLQITGNLTTPEYGYFRRTCKSIEASLFSSFSQEFFTKKQFMLTEFSLQTLVAISKSRFSHCLVHVIIGLEQPSKGHYVQYHVTSPGGTSLIDPAKHNYQILTHVNTEAFLNTGQDIELLAEAFSGLSNLLTIGMRDFNSVSRNRDYPQIQWRSYGMGTDEAAGGKLEISDSSGQLQRHHHRVFLNTLIALGKSGTRPKRYEVILRKVSLFDQAFKLPEYVKPYVQPVLASLETIFLDCYLVPNAIYTYTANGNPKPCTSFFLRSFLSELPQLRCLRLNFRLHQFWEGEKLLKWLSKPVLHTSEINVVQSELPQPPKPIHFLHLQQLDIGVVSVTTTSLIALLQKFAATLRSISFHKVALQEVMRAGDPKVSFWAEFFDQLLKLDNLNLTSISLSHLYHHREGNNIVPTITFKGSKYAMSKKWSGPDMQSGLRDFRDQMIVTWPSERDPPSSDEDEEIEDSFSDDDGDNDDDDMDSEGSDE